MQIFRGLIDSQFDKSKVGLGFVFFLLPFILIFALWMMFGIAVNYASFAISMIRELVYWVLASLLLFVLLMAFKGKEVKGRFSSIMAAFSVTYLITFLAAVLTMIVIFISIPGFFSKISSLQGRDLTFDQLVSVMSSLALPSVEIQILVFVALLVIGLVAILSGLHVFYRIGNLVKQTTGFSNLLFLVVFLGLAFLLNSTLNYIFSFI